LLKPAGQQWTVSLNYLCRMSKFHPKILLLLFTFSIFINIPSSYAQLPQNFNYLIRNGGFIVKDGSNRFRYRERDTFIPASTLKIVTCLAALQILGKNHQFKTHFFQDEQKNLYIKGYGDPFLTSETIRSIAEKLYDRGVKQISSLFLDDSTFAVDSLAAGSTYSANPFDAPNGALAVNFNSVPLVISATGKITSGEPQTPLIPIMAEIGKNLPPGTHRININILPALNGISAPLRYTGQLITKIFNEVGITIKNGFQAGIPPSHLSAIYTHISEKKLTDVIRGCLQYSNNYIANQLFLACGAALYGYPASWNKSRDVFRKYAQEHLGLSTDTFNMVEGSGLSRRNKISPLGLLTAVELFQPYADLLNKRASIFVKSGTLSDVFCYAGFFIRGSRLTPFVIMLNQPDNNRDELLTALYQGTL